MIKIIDSILKLYSEKNAGSGLSIEGEPEEFTDLSGVTLDDGSSLGFTFDDVKNTKIELQAEYDAQEYARNRQAEYPTIAELTVALYDTDDKSAVEAKRAAVKKKYPKP